MKKRAKEVADALEMIEESRLMVARIRRERMALQELTKAAKRQISESRAYLKKLNHSD